MARPCERGVALEVDGEQVCSPVAAEAEAGKGGGSMCLDRTASMGGGARGPDARRGCGGVRIGDHVQLSVKRTNLRHPTCFLTLVPLVYSISSDIS